MSDNTKFWMVAACEWLMVFSAVLAAVLCLVLLGRCANLPGGSSIGIQFQLGGRAPTHKEAAQAREQDKEQVLINGTPIEKSMYPAIVRIFINGASCTGTVVGPRTIVTAAHCAETGNVATFTTLSGKKYSATMQRAPVYPDKDLDVNLGLTDVDIDAPPMFMKLDKFERVGMALTFMGYGCTQPGGAGGNDGILRTGEAKVIGSNGDYDLVTSTPGGAALCYGDSGGPLLWKDASARFVVAGINSKGNIKDTNYTTRLSSAESVNFFKTWPSPICGVSKDCGSVVPPVPPTPPVPPAKSFSYENDSVKIQGMCK